MDRDAIAVGGFVVLFALMALRVPIGIAMGVVGVGGFALVASPSAALKLLATSPLRTVTDYNLSILPMFILMGVFATGAGMSRELFRAANAWLGHRKGGLAYATVTACAFFAAINGSSVATAATMTTVALPEMRRAGYHVGSAAGVIAAGGTLGIMIPPSVIFAIYGVLTEQDVGKLFIAGLLPGLLAVALYFVAIQAMCWRWPERLPAAERHGWGERLVALKDVWATVLLFVGVVGAMYGGVCTVTEAAAIGAAGALLIGVARGRLPPAKILDCLVEALRTTASIFVIVIGAFLFGYFLTITGTTQKLSQMMVDLPIGPYGVLTLILLAYLVLGAVMDELAMILLTVPIVFPVIVGLGFDPIWFGVIVVMVVELGLICPPVGMNVFVINSMARDVGLGAIYRGVGPFIAVDVLRLAILAAFPAISLYLPARMG
ncbi:MAG: TRAP transporter large permease [Alphaproteobacteria bacterium]|nr:TRAP transporter large permease [Alphaproteobacteria bacterium]